MTLLILVGLLLLIGLTSSLWWRRTSRRRSMPCPAWMSGLVKGPVMDWILGTRITLDRIGLKPGQRVLEIGPGPGRLLIPAAQRVLPGGEVVGLDIQPRMVEQLKARAAKVGVSNLTAILGDAAKPPVPRGSFDAVYLCTVLGEIPDREAALRQCYATLKPGGVLSITEIFPDPHYQSRNTVRRLGEGAGFRFGYYYGNWFSYSMSFAKPTL
ncbi:MAG: hypothetical protein CVU57_28875 [Deltaproteobacteria bacterium HGW-Deltaproteobacteria-15]|jgi:ubiquinone/menaquinone biosynthesis C-methylase UbiE|nr:MAG: hypothetical protein CVU57_28875 [Deltaproteobacteria bacterium HGW-Deltaproteobacteria-15]